VGDLTKLIDKIKEMDKENSLIKIDLIKNSIEYNEKFFKLHERIGELSKEEVVRAFLVVKLYTNFGYSKEQSIELEKRYTIGRPLKKGAKIDVFVNKNGNPFMMFEVKEPEKYEGEMDDAIKEQLFKVAPGIDAGKNTLKYLIYYTSYISDEDKVTEKIVTIDFKKFKTYEEWESAGKPNLMAIPKDYGVVRKPVFVKNSESDIRVDVTKDELDRIRLNIHNILWAGGKYHIELFFNLMGILLAKIYDERETEAGKAYGFQVFYEDGEPESPEKVYTRINELYKKALKDYLGYSDEDLKKVKEIVFDPPKVKYVVEILQGISLISNKYDILGDFFEKVVRNEFKQSKGQYLTHTNLVNFIIRALDIENLALHLINEEKRLPYIIDPACGSGTFLIESMKLITQHILQNREKLRKSTSVLEFVDVMFPPNRRNAWANRYIYGIEINLDLATATKVNMVGHGDGSANIESKDALIDFQEYTKDLLQVSKTSEIYPKPVNEQFDVVISNPPFSVTIDRDTAKNLPKVFMWGERIAEQLKKAKKKMEVSTENLFIERWYQLLRPKGRLGVVLPESVFDVTANKYVRLFLYKYFWIKAIVSLPDLAFQPYTPTKTSLLFAQKKTPEEVKEWDKLWNTYLNEYHSLRKRIEDLFKVRKGVLDYEKSQKELVDSLKELLGDNFDDKDGDLDIRELKEKYAEEIELADQDWWVFRKISQRLNYKIFMAHVDEIGYKRGLRGEEERENQLFQVDQNGNIIIDTENPKKVLDYLRRDVNGANRCQFFRFSFRF
jgi:type I restriction enzyme M protein